MPPHSSASGFASSRATKATRAIAEHGGWSLDYLGSPVSPRFAHHHWSPSAELTILPTSMTISQGMKTMHDVMAETRMNTLIIKVDEMDHPFVEAAIGIWTEKRRRWFVPMRPWMSPAADLWFVPDPYHPVLPECFLVSQDGLIEGQVPWRSDVDEFFGYVRADGRIAPFVP